MQINENQKNEGPYSDFYQRCNSHWCAVLYQVLIDLSVCHMFSCKCKEILFELNSEWQRGVECGWNVFWTSIHLLTRVHREDTEGEGKTDKVGSFWFFGTKEQTYSWQCVLFLTASLKIVLLTV